MDIKINKDIAKEYPDDAVKGYSKRDMLYIGTAAVLGLATIGALYYAAGVNIHAAVYAVMPVSGTVILIGFGNYKNMGVPEAFREWLRLTDQPVMAYEARENHYDYLEREELMEDAQDEYEKARKKENKRLEKARRQQRRFGRKGGRK